MAPGQEWVTALHTHPRCEAGPVAVWSRAFHRWQSPAWLGPTLRAWLSNLEGLLGLGGGQGATLLRAVYRPGWQEARSALRRQVSVPPAPRARSGLPS